MRRRQLFRISAAVIGVLIVVTLAAEAPDAGAAAAGPRVPVCVAPSTGHSLEVNARVTPAAADALIRRTRSYAGVCASYGESKAVGDGRAWAFSQSRGTVPAAIGVIMTTSSLAGLPVHPPTGGLWCYDVDGNGTIDPHAECTGGYEFVLKLSTEFLATADTPFQYALLNWNPMGHLPIGIYDQPHFDVHLYVTPNEQRLAIRPGPCGMLVDCADFEVGSLPVPPQYLPADYSDFSAVEPGMGNHLIDLTSPEVNGEPFTKTFIYGSYGGRLTFWEPMVAKAHYADLVSGSASGGCTDLKLPQAYVTAGWYPTQYCVRYRANRGELVTSLEGFVKRAAG